MTTNQTTWLMYFRRFAAVAFISCGSCLALAVMAATTPTLPPSTTSTLVPQLMTGATTQQKLGSLAIGERNGAVPTCTSASDAGCAKLCLNTNDPNDASKCIVSWSNLADRLGRFVDLHTDAVELRKSISNPDDGWVNNVSLYAQQNGYMDIRPFDTAGNLQAFTSIVKAPVPNACVFEDPRDDSGVCAHLGTLCRSNSDCGMIGYGLIANAGGSASGHNGYAGYFNGRVYIKSPSQDSWSRGQLCLGPAGSSATCITSWNDIGSTAARPIAVMLRSDNPATPQPRGATISGNSSFASVILSSNTCVLKTYTCGDGVCEADHCATERQACQTACGINVVCKAQCLGKFAAEASNNCAVDCAGLESPLVTASVDSSISAAITKLSVAFVTGKGITQLLVVRSTNSTPTFSPTNGATYAANEIFGTDTITSIHTMSAAELQRGIAEFTAGTLITGVNNYLRVYALNALPRYSPPSNTAVLKPYPIHASVSPVMAGGIVSSAVSGEFVAPPDGVINCSPTCDGFYNAGAVVYLQVDALDIHYAFSHWTGCDSVTNAVCTVIMNGAMSVSATFTQVKL